MARLRAPDGCPWDIEQTHQSIAQCLVDECCELLETIDNGDMDHMREELGDVLLQVVFHAQMAKEAGHFDFEEVAREINDKLIRRHPHVFGEENLESSEAVLKKWEEIKATEKRNADKPKSVFKDIPPPLPSTLYSYEIYKQIHKRELTSGELVDEKAIEEISTELDEESAGQIMFEIVSACRKSGIDPESALRRYASKVKAEVESLTELK
ncbi:MazG family protein [Puniceicoccaceae bacterium K14]|nr:MazG family protein [Puniceicoccaceae bacterium K14]